MLAILAKLGVLPVMPAMCSGRQLVDVLIFPLPDRNLIRL
jgi:hypothetical protein